MEVIQHKEEHDKNQIKNNNFEIKFEKLCYADIKKEIHFLIFWLIFFCWKNNFLNFVLVSLSVLDGKKQKTISPD